MINISIPQFDVLPSSALDLVRIFSDDAFVYISVSVNSEELIYEKYYPIQGYIDFSDLKGLIEQYFQKNIDSNFAECTIFANNNKNETSSKSFNVIYYDRSVDVLDFNEWLSKNFLSLTSIRSAAPSDLIPISYYLPGAEANQISIAASFKNKSGEISSFYYSLPVTVEWQPNRVITNIIDFSEIKRQIIQKADLDEDEITLLSVSYQVGDRVATFYIDNKKKASGSFFFLNCFNVWERINFTGITVEKSNSEREVAYIGKYIQNYDIRNSKVFECTSEPLFAFDAALYEEFFFSHEVRMQWGEDMNQEMDFSVMEKIIISDSTCEISDSDSDLNFVKFTWQFADSSVKQILPKSSKIFDDKYNFSFS